MTEVDGHTATLLGDPLVKAMLAEAAEAGAKRALAAVGLHDATAADDVRELRGLLEAYRDAKRTAFQAFIRWGVMLTLGAFAAGAVLGISRR